MTNQDDRDDTRGVILFCALMLVLVLVVVVGIVAGYKVLFSSAGHKALPRAASSPFTGPQAKAAQLEDQLLNNGFMQVTRQVAIVTSISLPVEGVWRNKREGIEVDIGADRSGPLISQVLVMPRFHWQVSCVVYLSEPSFADYLAWIRSAQVTRSVTLLGEERRHLDSYLLCEAA